MGRGTGGRHRMETLPEESIFVDFGQMGHEATCGKCWHQTILTDRRIHYADFATVDASDHDWHYYFICPICETPNILDEASLPEGFKTRAQERAAQ